MKRAATLCLAALMLVAAGCGGDDDGTSKEDYEKEVREAGQTLEKTFTNIGASISGAGSPKEAAAKLDEGADALEKTSGDLGDIEPPSDIEDSHDELVEGLDELADEFRNGADAAEEGDPTKLREFATSLSRSEAVQKIQSAGEEIEKKGYDFEN